MKLDHTYTHRRETESLEVTDAFIVLVRTDLYPSKGHLATNKSKKLYISSGLFLGGTKVEVYFLSKTEDFQKGDTIFSKTKKLHVITDESEAILYKNLGRWNKVLATSENMTEEQMQLLVDGKLNDYDHVMLACEDSNLIFNEGKLTIHLPSKQIINDINDVINMINRVRTEFNTYYATISNNPIYKTNCSIDQDRLQKAILKLHSISKAVEETTNEKANSKIQRSTVESEAN